MSRHFARHLLNKHKDEKEVVEIQNLPKKNVQRAQLLTLLRNDGNMDAAEHGFIIPKRLIKGEEITAETHIICSTCKSYFKKGYISRHKKACFAKSKDEDLVSRRSAVMDSYVYSACHRKLGSVLNQMHLKTEVLARMRPDAITKEILGDILIISWGDDLLKKLPNHRSNYQVSAKMRRLANFLVQIRAQNPRYSNLLSCLHPDAFDDVIAAVKITSRYNPETRIFKSPSTALQFGTYLKQIADLTCKLIYRKKIPLPVKDIEEFLKNLKRFRHLVDTQWTVELASLAMKNLSRNAAKKTLVLPLTEDVIQLKKYTDQYAEDAYNELKKKPSMKAYSVLAETTLVSSIIHNRKRAGDIHFLQLDSFREQRNCPNLTTGVEEFLQSLSPSEKIMVQSYFKYTSDSKTCQNVPILVPQVKLKHYDMLLKLREEKKGEWFPTTNNFFFTLPKSARWISGITNILKYGKKCGAKHPELLTVSRLRKHIATVTQLLSLRPNEIEQLSKFLGHTKSTHETFYK